jgi:hypothetical protein
LTLQLRRAHFRNRCKEQRRMHTQHARRNRRHKRGTARREGRTTEGASRRHGTAAHVHCGRARSGLSPCCIGRMDWHAVFILERRMTSVSPIPHGEWLVSVRRVRTKSLRRIAGDGGC